MEPAGLPQALVLLDYFGIAVFAVSGALLAAERRQTLEEAERTYAAVTGVYRDLGYTLVELPRAPVEARVRFVLDRVARPDQRAGASPDTRP